jgi:hypothetical protein
VGALAFTPDGQTLVAAEFATRQQFENAGPPIRRWDLATGVAQPPLDAGSALPARLSFSPDGRRLFGVDRDGGARAWEWPAGRLLWQVPPPAGAGIGPVTMSAVAPDGQKLAGPTARGSLRVFDATTGAPAGDLEGHSNATYAAAFAPDGRTLATGGGDGVIRVWDVETGLSLHHMAAHGGSVFALAYSPDAALLASGGSDASILLWDATKLGRPPAKVPPPAPVLTPEQLAQCWQDLGSDDAKTAYRAVRTLAASPEQSVPRLKELVPPVPRVDPARLAALLADLDHDQFVRRQRAMEALAALDTAARDALQQHLATVSSAEARQRTEELLHRIERQELSGEALRQARAVEALERTGTPAARAVLEELAKGQPGATLTRQAEAALGRMKK